MRKRLSIAAIVGAVVLYLGASGWAVWYTYDATVTSPEEDSTAATGPGEDAPDLVTVPSYVGEDGFRAAFRAKRGLKLDVVVVRAPSVSVAIDRVISQNPEQGSEVPPNSLLELTVSSGPP